MKTIIRNFFSMLRRFKMATLLNVLGLSVAFAAFIVIMIQVSYDLRFDSSIPDADNVYRINIEYNSARTAATPRPIGEGFAVYSPYVKAVAITNAMFASVFDRFFSVDTESRMQIYAEKMMETTAGYIGIFQPEIVEGSAQAILEPEKVLIPQSMAQRIFKGESAINKQLRGEDFVWTVGGVYKDFPKNSSVHNYILKQIAAERNISNWGTLNYETYVSVDRSQDADALFAEYIATIDPHVFANAGYNNVAFFLTPIRALHFDTATDFDTVEKTSKTKLWILIGIAFVILLIAAINFTNYSIAQAPLRIRSVNTQKVLGATGYALRSSLVTEAVLISLISFGIALLLVYLLSLTSVSGLLTSDLILSDNVSLLLIVALIALLTGLLAGIYPAYYITSFAPALVLSGNFGLSPHGRRLRSLLVGFQFVASFVLIVIAIFMFIQTNYMQRRDTGYDRSQIIVVTTNRQFSDQYELFSGELRSFSGIESISYSESLLASRDFYSSSTANHKGSKIIFQAMGVDVDFLQTIGIPLLEGRYFNKSDMQTKGEYFIVFNEQARKNYDLQIGDRLDGLTVIGFIPDVNYGSLRKKIEPMGFFLFPDNNPGARRFAYLRVEDGVNVHSAMQHVEKTLQHLSPGFPFDIRLLEEISNSLYIKENNIMLLITLFSLLAVMLSMAGVFGLVVFEGEYKRKEIGIRKVFGSTTKQILEMLNKRYTYMLAICFIIAAPLSWATIYIWLQNFAYKTPMYWWVFAVAFLLVAVLTFLTVTLQSRRIANANPVDSIKTE